MNRHQALESAVESPDFLVLSGSRLYGTNREDSDEDYRGFVIPPYEYILGFAQFKDMDVEGADHKVYSLKRYLDLVTIGDPQCTELLFAPESHIFARSKYAVRVLNLRDSIVSNNIYRRVMGFSYSEWRKAQGKKLVIEDKTKIEEDIISDIRNTFQLDKDSMDSVLETLLENKKKTLVNHKKNLGSKRKAEFEKYGFGFSSAAHAIRLVQEVRELLSTGFISFPRPNGNVLRDIRQGKYDFDEVEEVYEYSRKKAEEARDNSVLRDKPDLKLIRKEYEDIILQFLKEDDRFSI